jgi:hypothetical protein
MHEARLYYLNPGAAASSAARVDIFDVNSGKTRELWLGPPEIEPPQWIDADTVAVGEQVLDIREDLFNWYEDQPIGGHESPEEAALSFVTAVAADDLAAAQNASGPVLTTGAFDDLRNRLLSTDAPASVNAIELTRDPRTTASDQRVYLVDLRILIDGDVRELRLEALVVLESGKWRAEWLEPKGTYTAAPAHRTALASSPEGLAFGPSACGQLRDDRVRVG